MDARITRTRISNILSYDWLKMIITVVVAIFVGVMVLSMIGTRPTTAQEIYLLYYKDIYLSDDYSDIVDEKSDEIFSYEVFSTNYFEMSSDSTYGSIALSARFAAGQRNMLFSSIGMADDDTTYVEEASKNCTTMIEDVDEYLADAAEYLNAFYGGDYLNGEIDEEYLSEQFRERNKEDKRYKTEEKILAGIEDEKDRINLLRSSLITVNGALENGTIEKYYMAIEEGGEEKPYAVIIGTKKMSSLVELMYLYDSDTQTRSSEGICACFLSPLNSSCEYMRFESLDFIAYLINTYAAV